MIIDIAKRQIQYNNHMVTMDIVNGAPESFYSIELKEMAEYLSVDGDARTHARELRMINNDGTWGIKNV